MTREAAFRKLMTDFPGSPMGFFSFGRLCLEEKRFAEAADAFQNACRIDETYAAAWVSLGDAWLGLGNTDNAKAAFEKALQTPHAQKDASLRGDLEDRLSALQDDFA